MRFMLLQNYGEVESDCPPMTEWSPADVKAHIKFQVVLNEELSKRGELGARMPRAWLDRSRPGLSSRTGCATNPSLPTGRSPSRKSCWPDIGWWTWSPPTGPSRSPLRHQRRQGPVAHRSASRSRCCQVLSAPDPDL